MTDEQSFLDMILDAPDEDGPRLLYADWLSQTRPPDATIHEGGEEIPVVGRAEFIRVQCAIAGLTDVCSREDCECPRCISLRALRRCEAELFAQSGETRSWFGPALRLTVAGRRWIDLLAWFHRGFVSEVTCSWDDFARHAEELLSFCPIRNAREGSVALLTWPTLELTSPPGRWPYTVRLSGRQTEHSMSDEPQDMDEFARHGATGAATLRVLRQEFPGVRIVPPDYRPYGERGVASAEIPGSPLEIQIRG